MEEQAKFPGLPQAEGQRETPPEGPGKVRVASPERTQVKLVPLALEALIAADHPARTVWQFVSGLDLKMLYDEVQSVEGRAGRPAIDPALLLALWLYGLADDVRSSRELEQLCREHDAYRWLCGGVSVNYHTLSDFRTQSQVFDTLLTQMLAVLTKEGVLKVQRVAQDGMRIRASAGASSFHGRDSLKGHLRAAAERVKLAKETDTTPGVSERKRKAEQRAAEDRERRIRRAQELLPQAEKAMETRPPSKRSGEPRTSTTDPEARVMKMADGGFRPAYNGEVASDTNTTIIVGVDVVNVGSDMAQLSPMLEQIEKRFGYLPQEVLVDGGFPSAETLEHAAGCGVTVYAPVPKPRETGASTRGRYEPAKGDTPEKIAWRKRMATAESQKVYRLRAATAELVNARLRRYGLRALTVRGLEKARAMLLLSALTHNLFRAHAIRTNALAS
jgi:transposase